MKIFNISTLIIVLLFQFQIASADSFTPSTSEEYPPLTVNNKNAVTGLRCTGSYCDNVALKYHSFINRVTTGNSWTSYFSEEGTSWRYCSNNKLVTGIACKGKYCDDISLQCTGFTGLVTSACQWSGWVSEEFGGTLNLPAGKYVAGVQCSGSYCDNKRVYYCSIN